LVNCHKKSLIVINPAIGKLCAYNYFFKNEASDINKLTIDCTPMSDHHILDRTVSHIFYSNKNSQALSIIIQVYKSKKCILGCVQSQYHSKSSVNNSIHIKRH